MWKGVCFILVERSNFVLRMREEIFEEVCGFVNQSLRQEQIYLREDFDEVVCWEFVDRVKYYLDCLGNESLRRFQKREIVF